MWKVSTPKLLTVMVGVAVPLFNVIEPVLFWIVQPLRDWVLVSVKLIDPRVTPTPKRMPKLSGMPAELTRLVVNTAESPAAAVRVRVFKPAILPATHALGSDQANAEMV